MPSKRWTKHTVTLSAIVGGLATEIFYGLREKGLGLEGVASLFGAPGAGLVANLIARTAGAALTGLGINLFSARLTEDVDDGLNHALAQASGAAIAAVIRLEAPRDKRLLPKQVQLEKLAAEVQKRHSPDALEAAAKEALPIDPGEVFEDPKGFLRRNALGKSEWEDYLRRVASDACLKLHLIGTDVATIAEVLEEHYTEALYRAVQANAAADGKAVAGATMRLLNTVLVSIDEKHQGLSSTSEATWRAVLKLREDLDISRITTAIDALSKAADGHAELCQQLHGMIEDLPRRLDTLTSEVAAAMSNFNSTSILDQEQPYQFDSVDDEITVVNLRHAGLALPANTMFVDLHAVVIEKRLPEGRQSLTTYDLIHSLRRTNGISDPVQLSSLFKEAMRRGGRRCVLVRGDIGSGKSTLLKAFACAARKHDETMVPSSKCPIVAWIDARSMPDLADVSSVLASASSCGQAAAKSYRERNASVLVIVDDLQLNPNPDVALAKLAQLSKSDDVFVMASCNQYDSRDMAHVSSAVLDVILCHPTRAQVVSIIEATTQAGARSLIGDPEKAAERAAVWKHEAVRHVDQIIFDASILSDVTFWKYRIPDLAIATPAFWAELTDMIMDNCSALRIPYMRPDGLGPPEDCSAFSYVELSMEFLRGRLQSKTSDKADVAAIIEGACTWAAGAMFGELHKLFARSAYKDSGARALEEWHIVSDERRSSVIALLARLGYLDSASRADGGGLPKPAERSTSGPMAWHLAAMWLVRRLDDNKFIELKQQLIEDSIAEGKKGANQYDVWSFGRPKPAFALLVAMCSASALGNRLEQALDVVRVFTEKHISFACMLLASCPRVTMALVEETLVRPDDRRLSTMYSGPDYEIRGRIVACCLDWFGRGNLTAEFLIRLGERTTTVADLYFLDNAVNIVGCALYGKLREEVKALRYRLYETLGSPGSWIAWCDEAAKVPRWAWLPRSWARTEDKWLPSSDGVWTFSTPVRADEIEDLCRRKGDRRAFRSTTWYDAVVFCRWVGIHTRGTLEGRLPTCDEIEGMYEAWRYGRGCPIQTAGLEAAIDFQNRDPSSERGLADSWGARGEEMSCNTASRAELADMGEMTVTPWSLGPFWCGVSAEQDKGLVFHRGKFVANAWYNLTGENAVFRPVIPMELPAWKGYEEILDKTYDRWLWLIPTRTVGAEVGFLKSILGIRRSKDV